jgi:hypothetical protein
MSAVDWSNPCQRATALQNAYYNILAGAAEQEIRTRTLDAEEVVRFYQTNIGTLLAELTAAQAECSRQTGAPDPNRRFFIGAGSRRPWFLGGRGRW